MATELTYPELISEIRRLSLEKQNGTIFITSTDGHIARIVLNEGTITYLIFDSNHTGSEAIPHIQAIKLARLQFVGGSFESYQAGTLPSTEEIFAQLSAVKIIPEKSRDFSTSTQKKPIAKKNHEFSTSTDLNQAIESIKITLADYIGPIANVLCDDYIQQIKPTNTKSDITVMIETLALEIEKPDEQEEFKSNLKKYWFQTT
jgi:hypothetical protein